MVIYNSVRTLLSEAIDYAGLYPPVEIDASSAARNYLAIHKGPAAWALGRLVVPATRLGELRAASTSKSMRISATVVQLDAELPLVEKAGVDTIELKAGTPAQIRSASEKIPANITAYYEIALAQDPRKCIEAIGEAGGVAKARTGGTTVDGFPGSRDLARFIEACVDQNVAFKVTDGLQHAVRGSYALDKAGPVLMHGFLNIFLAAAFVRAGMEPVQVVKLLEDTNRKAFKFEAESVHWHDETLATDEIRDARTHVAMSFGVASFEEPLADLAAFKMI